MLSPFYKAKQRVRINQKKLSLKTKIAEKYHGYYFRLSVQWRHNNKIDGLGVDYPSLL